jgi:DNA-3-methyladenine glycosylase II
MEAKILFFNYGKTEIDYLKNKDKVLGAAIDKIGYIKHPINTDLFSSLIFQIIGQQISSVAHKTIWKRLNEKIGIITPEIICDLSTDEIQKLGMTFRKAGYIKNIAEKAKNDELNIENVKNKNDNEIINELKKLDGIGQWTAEMVLIFCFQRKNIISYNDMAIHRGLRMLYHHKNIDKKIFEKYRNRYNPYNSVASLYLWSIAAGSIEQLKDYDLKKNIPEFVEKKKKYNDKK